MNEALFVEQLQQYYKNKNTLTLTEVNFSYGVADLVLLDINHKKFGLRKKREQWNTLLNRKYFEILSVLPDIDDNLAPISINEMVSKSGISQSYIRSYILKDLIAGGFVKSIDKGYVKVNGWVPIAEKVTAIEAKLSDWKRGIWQAQRYLNVANAAYLAMPPDYIHRVDTKECEKAGIGLICFDPITHDFNELVKPIDLPASDPPIRNYVTELFLDEHQLLSV